MKHTKAKKEINKIYKQAIDYLCLQDWEITVKFMDGECADGQKAVMTNTIDLTYLRSTIQIWNPAYLLDDKEIAHSFIHELCHIYTEDLYSIARANVNPHLHPFIEEKREQLTERIARLVKI